jgi:Tfp pilus assembly protein PilF
MFLGGLSGCATEPSGEGVDSEIEEGIREKARAFSEAQAQISLGSPASIEEALELIAAAELASTDRGSELLYIARQIYRIVYPYLPFPVESVPQLAETSLYRRLFSTVEEGRIPSVAEEEASFLTTLISSLALFTTQEAQTVRNAEALADQMLTINPASILAQYVKAYALERQDEAAAALERYRTIVEEAPGCYPARMGIVRVLNASDRGAQALEQATLLLERFAGQREVVRLVVESFLQAGQLERADALLANALGRFPEDSVLLRKRALLLERTGRTEQARRIIRIVEDREGESAESLLVRIRLLEARGQLGEALVAAQNGRTRYPEATEIHLAQARLLLERGRPGDARRELMELREKLPEHHRVKTLLLEALIGEQRWQEARELLDELLRQGESKELLGKAVRIYRALGRMERALEYASRLAEEYPQDHEAIEQYVRQLIAAGRREAARTYLNRRLDEAQESTLRSRLYYLLSEVQTDTQARIRSLQSALFENMQNEAALIKISELYESMGEYKKAVRYLRQAVSLDPQNRDWKERLRRLESQLR